jgi:glyoxylase-like metal-dependent hydrolase (beta-lactamase superfamily II)
MGKTWFTVKELYAGIWGLAEFGHNEKVISYLFVGAKKCLLFDSGMGIGDIKKEVEKITKLPVIVINSHCHFDHIGGNTLFTEIALFNSEFSKNISVEGYANEELKEYLAKQLFTQSPPKGFSSDGYNIKPFKHTKLFKNKAVFEIEPFIFEVISTPGHSPDSICLLEKTKSLLLTGDTFYPGPIYLHFPESNYEEYIVSIKKLSKISNVLDILPGHNNFHMDKRVLGLTLEKLLTYKHINKKTFTLNVENISLLFKEQSCS